MRNSIVYTRSKGERNFAKKTSTRRWQFSVFIGLNWLQNFLRLTCTEIQKFFISVEGFLSAVSRSWVKHFHIVDLATRTATMHCVRWDKLLITFQTWVRERPHSRFETAFICEQRTIPVFAGKLEAISHVFSECQWWFISNKMILSTASNFD